MPTVAGEERLTPRIGAWLIGLSALIVPIQMSGVGAILTVDWPPWVYYAIMAVCWGTGGGLIGRKYRLPAILGGVVGGVGCLAAITTLLMTNSLWIPVVPQTLIAVGVIGAAPGVLLTFALAWLQDRIFPPPAAPDANETLPHGQASDGIRTG